MWSLFAARAHGNGVWSCSFHTNVEHVGGQNYQVAGNLTLHGVTRPITFDVIYHGQNSLMNTCPHLTAKATINRRDFGLGQGVAVRTAASSMVTVEIELEAVQQSVEVHEAASTAEKQEETSMLEKRVY